MLTDQSQQESTMGVRTQSDKRHDSISTAAIGWPKTRYLSKLVLQWSDSWVTYVAEVQWIANKG